MITGFVSLPPAAGEDASHNVFRILTFDEDKRATCYRSYRFFDACLLTSTSVKRAKLLNIDILRLRQQRRTWNESCLWVHHPNGPGCPFGKCSVISTELLCRTKLACNRTQAGTRLDHSNHVNDDPSYVLEESDVLLTSMSTPTPLRSFIGGFGLSLPVHALLLLNGNVFGISGFFHRAVKGNLEALGANTAVLGLKMRQVLLSGFLVGLGTKMSNGCTSGHMICGISRLSKRYIKKVRM
ncbi:hypothetical protein DFS33DRAFT_335944 [Desarmillaria ectypa]|nr:hypothetical protein DFS33DRAFT_335944 [Desarmillaria ectypa]